MRILFVDDEEMLIRAARRALRQGGWDIDFVVGGRAALEALKVAHYDLVLTDLEMPDVGGREIVRHVKAHSPSTRCIFVTGSNLPRATLDAQVIEKPYEPAALRALISEYELSLRRTKHTQSDPPG